MGVCDFSLTINSNLGLFSHRFATISLLRTDYGLADRRHIVPRTPYSMAVARQKERRYG